MKVVLTHGYFLKEDEKEQTVMRPYPPLGLLYISAYLKEKDINNKVFDSTFYSKEDLREFLQTEQPDVLAIYANLMTKVNVLQIIAETKNNLPNCRIILGGPDVTYNVEAYLTNGADFLIIGEGEQTMQELVMQLQKKDGDVSLVDGIAFLDSSRKVVKTKARMKLKDVNELPIPNREAVDLSLYLKAWKDHHGESALNVSTQRGCPYTCKWCSTAVYGQSYRRRSPDNVVKELKLIQEKYNPDTIWFVDDVFTVSHKWLKAMADELEAQNVTVRFECISRADRMNDEVIEVLRRMGCFRIWIGAESGSQKIIDAMDRRVSVHKVREMIQKTRKAGIQAGTFIMLGYPGETGEDIKETIRHLKEANPDYFTITIAYPIKGTSLYNEIEDIQTKNLDWSKSTDRDRDFERIYPRKYYEHALIRVVNEVNYYKTIKKSGLSLKAAKMKTRALMAAVGMQMAKS